ncbi:MULTISPECIES: phosphohydrolase [unclassified Cryobacterium]|uniref:phosphohydrolase n=1 Tax=unclassified Cryobacterium TaxID=2649013 RepID=UPI00106A45F1|nr:MULTISPECIES: phosphohydrolase [unclassified Cryobacterium]MDY7527342.1 hypothetical protein [Cryobacterium sp. 10C2]MDY7556871.1 hypothetical protein [Cryobacterium sp. 10C3]MEB0002280.1 hypothetical protein [Cryobacterium sp. RTC2.1]MEB0202396.1 hypothetical protein [Cryobacterium sp. 5I3]MEB0287384.1 hypothetical protein [Cryobacterium sp. 10S3]
MNTLSLTHFSQRGQRQGDDSHSSLLLADALRFARTACAGKRDEAGEAAIEHPLRVMAALAREDEKVVALLHDTCASSGPGLAGLRGFVPNRLLMAVTALGHGFEETDEISFRFLLADPIALAVKLACVGDLTDPGRLARLDPFTRRRREIAGAAAARGLGTTLDAIRTPFATP